MNISQCLFYPNILFHIFKTSVPTLEYNYKIEFFKISTVWIVCMDFTLKFQIT